MATMTQEQKNRTPRPSGPPAPPMGRTGTGGTTYGPPVPPRPPTTGKQAAPNINSSTGQPGSLYGGNGRYQAASNPINLNQQRTNMGAMPQPQMRQDEWQRMMNRPGLTITDANGTRTNPGVNPDMTPPPGRMVGPSPYAPRTGGVTAGDMVDVPGFGQMPRGLLTQLQTRLQQRKQSPMQQYQMPYADPVTGQKMVWNGTGYIPASQLPPPDVPQMSLDQRLALNQQQRPTGGSYGPPVGGRPVNPNFDSGRPAPNEEPRAYAPGFQGQNPKGLRGIPVAGPYEGAGPYADNLDRMNPSGIPVAGPYEADVMPSGPFEAMRPVDYSRFPQYRPSGPVGPATGPAGSPGPQDMAWHPYGNDNIGIGVDVGRPAPPVRDEPAVAQLPTLPQGPFVNPNPTPPPPPPAPPVMTAPTTGTVTTPSPYPNKPSPGMDYYWDASRGDWVKAGNPAVTAAPPPPPAPPASSPFAGHAWGGGPEAFGAGRSPVATSMGDFYTVYGGGLGRPGASYPTQQQLYDQMNGNPVLPAGVSGYGNSNPAGPMPTQQMPSWY